MIVRVPCTLLGIRSFTQKNRFCGDSMRMLKKNQKPTYTYSAIWWPQILTI